jgi:hypothetical protein
MRKNLLYLCVLLIFISSCSEKITEEKKQDSISVSNVKADDYEANYIEFSQTILKVDEQTIVTEETILYSDSLLKNTSKSSLQEGQIVFIQKYCGTLKNGNWAEPIYHVKIISNENYISYGYISQSKIACYNDTLSSGHLVYLTLDYNHETDHFMSKILLTDHIGKLLDRNSMNLNILIEDDAPHSFYYYFDIIEHKKTGLDGVIDAFNIHAGYDACGYPSADQIFLWNGIKLIIGPSSSSISDADVFYSFSSLEFPSDSLGKQGYITEIITSEEPVNDDLEESDSTEYRKDSTVILYKWDKNEGYAKGDTVTKMTKTYIRKYQE